ncbi:MAG: helix-turn-helix domain-containing protein [Myxococcota bacterium]|nr:helix-turn-helix domain-containing protein [Myxococcota bacterium]
MKSIGHTLQKAREARGLSVEDVARVTRISRATIEALEADDRAALPAEVYVRGFTRNIASILGLDPQELLRTHATEQPAAMAAAHRRDEDRFAIVLGYGQPDAEPTFALSHVTMALAALGMFLAAWLLVGQRTEPHATALDHHGNVPAIQEHVDAVTPFTAQDLRANARR